MTWLLLVVVLGEGSGTWDGPSCWARYLPGSPGGASGGGEGETTKLTRRTEAEKPTKSPARRDSPAAAPGSCVTSALTGPAAVLCQPCINLQAGDYCRPPSCCTGISSPRWHAAAEMEGPLCSRMSAKGCCLISSSFSLGCWVHVASSQGGGSSEYS